MDCSASPTVKFNNGLTTDRVIHMRGHNFIFGDGGRVGIGLTMAGVNMSCNVGNKLEIINTAGNPYFTGSGAGSGLRFRYLTSASAVTPNGTNGVNSLKVLTTDQNGDVVLTDAISGFGADCGTPSSGLLPSNWHVGLNNHTLNFDGPGMIRIGDILNCPTTNWARVWIRNTSAGSPNTAFRVDHAASGTPSYAAEFFGNVFINGIPSSVQTNFNVSDKTIKKNITTITKSLDIISQIKASSFQLDNTTVPQLNIDSTKTYGFIAQNIETILPELVKNVVIPASYDDSGNIVNPSVTLKSLNYTGILPFAIAGIQELNTKQNAMQIAIAGLSDAQVKTNVNTFNALATVKTLSPVKYNFTNSNVPQLSFKPNTDYGFIAQQLETVYPELVDTIRVNATYDSLGTVINPSKVLKTVNYKAMSALLVRSVQEQQQTIDSLRSTQNAILQQLSALASQINACCSNTNSARQSNSNINQLDVELSDKDAIVLNQNVPNPFAEQTTITYNVPANIGKAQIIFFNNLGQVIQSVDIKTRGKGKLNVFASDLSSGLYNYSLVADGKVIDSKKMVRE